MLTPRQAKLIERYVAEFPHLAEIEERARRDPKQYRELGNAMAMIPYPKWVDGTDALEIGSIGIDAEKTD